MTLRDIQEEQLFILVRTAKDTKIGKKFNFSDLQRYENFRDAVPIHFYDDIKSEIEDVKSGSENIFWPGRISNFAVSAGTSGEGKHLPISDRRLKADRKFMNRVALSYLKQRPNIFRIWGKHLSLPGSLEHQKNITLGEISAFTAQQTPGWLSHFQLLKPDELTSLPFSKKIQESLDKGLKFDLRVITSAPSWLLTMFQEIINQKKVETVAEIWPKLQLLVCGGVKLSSYKQQLQQLIGKEVDFIETYGASEGYFSFTDKLDRQDMKLVTDNGIFYEFIPDPLPDHDSLSIQQAVPLWEVETHTPYAMIVTTNSGLWRYPMNDIVEFTETDPPRIKVMGRVSEMLDDYGEALYGYEAHDAINKAATDLDLTIGEFTVGADLPDKKTAPKHFWFIQFPNPIHRETLEKLARKTDAILQKKNRHYAIRRESDALDLPEFHSITQKQINDWLRKNNKQKAQGKLPTILHQKEDIEFFK